MAQRVSDLCLVASFVVGVLVTRASDRIAVVRIGDGGQLNSGESVVDVVAIQLRGGSRRRWRNW